MVFHFNVFVRFDKPHNAPYEVVSEKFGEVNGSIWMIGDNPICDIQGSRNSIGAITFQKKHNGVKILSGEESPDFVFDEFTDLRGFFRKLTKNS